ALKAVNSVCSSEPASAWKRLKARRSLLSLKWAAAAYAADLALDRVLGGWISDFRSRPSSESACRLIKSGLPANAEGLSYGEKPAPGGPTGNICHQRWPAAARKSANSNASGPRSPTP